MVQSRTIPQGNGHLATAAIEPARKKSKDGKMETRTVDANVDTNADPSLSSPAMDSGIFSLGGDAGLQRMTNISTTNLSESKAKKTRKKKEKKKKETVLSLAMVTDESNKVEIDSSADGDANPTPSFEMDFETLSHLEDPNWEGATSVGSAGSSTSSKKKENKANVTEVATTSFIITGNLDTDINLSAFGDQDIDGDTSLNPSDNSNTDLPLFAATFLLIVGLIISSVIIVLLKEQILVRMLILGYVFIVLLTTLWIVNAARRNNGNIYSHTDDDEKKFPPDCYSFVALYNPKTDTDVFCFGLMVFLFQSALFSLMILSVIIPSLRTSGEVDTPDSDFFAQFIPSNVEPIVRVTQIVAMLSSVVFPDASLLDISTGIEMFPQLCKRNQDEKVWCIALACILRCLQGFLAIVAIFLLVMTSSDVTEIVLNFTAVSDNKKFSGNDSFLSENLLFFSHYFVF